MNDKLEEKLRNSITYRKGALGEALSEGAKMWIDKKSKKNSFSLTNSKKSRDKTMVKK